jgi:hypothetical protein
MFTVSLYFPALALGTTPRGLITHGFSLGGNNVIAFAASFFATGPETDLRCSNAEEVMANSLLGGGDTVRRRR